MHRTKRLAALALAGMLALGSAWAGGVDVGRYIQKDEFNQLKLSPDGAHFAATVPFEDRTVLVLIRRSDRKVVSTFRLGKNSHVSSFHWVNPERVVVSVAEKFGDLNQPLSTGELFVVAPGTDKAELLADNEMRVSWLVDDLPVDDRRIIVGWAPHAADPYTYADLVDIYSGDRTRLGRTPMRNASLTTDNRGVVRFAFGVDKDNVRQLHYRNDRDSDWELLATDKDTGRIEWPVGFSPDDRIAYLEVEQKTGPNALVAFDTATRTRQEVARNAHSDPSAILYRNGSSAPIGALFLGGKPQTQFFDAGAREAQLHRSLEKAFAGQAVSITSQTQDGRLVMVQVWSDRNPGDFYLYDTVAKKAEHIQSRRTWVDPEQMAVMKDVQIRARDGLLLHGFLSVPAGRPAQRLPLIVLPHGGPYGIQDIWGFDTEVQMLADAGYAVLQVNFRGSGGYGRAFQMAGARQWGLTMQDDLTDATRWAIEQAVADPERICMYGGSYGAYASLMALAKEPSLYRCAVGYVGVYDLPSMQREAARDGRRIRTWSEEWVGESDSLKDVSPNRIASRIKAPVFLAAGGMDDVAPQRHSKLMEDALVEVGVPVETMYVRTEGHGFYLEKNQREFYTRMLAFLARHLGGETAAEPAGGASGRGK